jgi:DnaK suppressor protein
MAARHALLERRRTLLRRTSRAQQDERDLLELREADWEDQAANETAARFLDRLTETERLQLQRVQSALDRIENGRYGMCVICGERIAAARLKAVPEADRCGGCTN